MTNRKRGEVQEAPPADTAPRSKEGDEAERLLGRLVARGLPLLCIVAAVIIGLIASVGSAVLVLASGALLGTIALLWASIRTLTGDAPLPAELEEAAAREHHDDGLEEQKRMVLLALKDLEGEHQIGKLDDADYQEMADRYRAQAKDVMREMDRNIAPARAEAEKMAQAYLSAHGLGEPGRTRGESSSATGKGEPRVGADDARTACVRCGTSNEGDATFCKSCGSPVRRGSSGKDDSDAAT